MLGILRLAFGSLFLILTVLFFTVSAQQTTTINKDDSPTVKLTTAAMDWKSEFVLSETARRHDGQTNETKSFNEKNRTNLFSPKHFKTISHPLKEDAAQSETEKTNNVYKHQRGAIEFNFEFGVSPMRPTKFAGPDEYDRSQRRMTTIDIRIARTLGTKGGVSYAYMFGITPLVVAFRNEVRNPDFISATATPNVAPTVRETSYGFGISPVNFRFTFMPNRRIKPFLKLGAGALYFNKALPVPVAGRYHFMGDWGGGLMIHSKNNPKQFWTLGYRYLHISNANIYGKKNNPGYNANTLYLGFSFFR